METDHELSNIVLLSLVDILKIENWGKIFETGNLEIEFLSYIADTVDLGPSSVQCYSLSLLFSIHTGLCCFSAQSLYYLYKSEVSSLGVDEEKMKMKSHVHEIDNCTDYRMQMT